MPHRLIWGDNAGSPDRPLLRRGYGANPGPTFTGKGKHSALDAAVRRARIDLGMNG